MSDSYEGLEIKPVIEAYESLFKFCDEAMDIDITSFKNDDDRYNFVLLLGKLQGCLAILEDIILPSFEDGDFEEEEEEE